MRRHAGIVVILACVASGLLMALDILPFPHCPIARFFHFRCPMCGSCHAWAMCISGNWSAAFRANPLFVYWAVVLVIAAYDMMLQATQQDRRIMARLYETMRGHRGLYYAHNAVIVSTMIYLNVIR